MSTTPFAPVTAIIDCSNLRHNVRQIRKRTPGLSIIAVVKANAYGHGSIRVASELRAIGIDRFAVATVPEAIELRESGVNEPVIVFAPPSEASAPAYEAYDLDAVVVSESDREALDHSTGVRVHVNMDTGMHRLGVEPNRAVSLVRSVEKQDGLTLASVWTHLASASTLDQSVSRRQWDLFSQILSAFGEAPAEVHVASTSAIFNFPESIDPSIVSAARIGIGLFGALRLPERAGSTGLLQTMSLSSMIYQIRRVAAGSPVSYGGRWSAPTDRLIATLGAGYADGYPRRLGGKSAVSINGDRYPVVGTVCMDMMMVDLGTPDGPGTSITPGTEATLFGDDATSVMDLAILADTIPYEILCGVSRRVPRIYV